jgi:hypothetical protein
MYFLGPLIVVGVIALTPIASAACSGDCDGDGQVTVDEIVAGVAIAIGSQPVGVCLRADRDGDLAVTVDEVVASVDAALRGCGPFFADVTAAAGVEYQGRPATGAAAGDCDGDGWIDLFVIDRRAPAILYRNRGDGTFADGTEGSGLEVLAADGVGPAWGDVDNDGDLDLYVTTNSNAAIRNFLFINDGQCRFSEEGVERGAAVVTPHVHRGFSATFGDFDGDGYIDLHTNEWNPVLQCVAQSHARLLRNRGAVQPGHFEDVTTAADVELGEDPFGSSDLVIPLAFASRFADLDDDGWPDLAVASDFGTSRLFWNNGNGTFTDGTIESGVGTDENGMGSAIDDFDGDGRLDWFVTSILETNPRCERPQFICGWGTTGNRLYRNEGGRRFSDVTDAVGVRHGFWGWGTSFLDFDNDGDLDLVMTNGTFEEAPADSPFRADPMRLWQNDGRRMIEVSAAMGLSATAAGKGLVVFDYDRDGDLDVWVGHDDAAPILYRNLRGNESGWLRVEVEGRSSNRDGLGARVELQIVAGGPTQTREVNAGSNFLGQNEGTAHFGLGIGQAPVARVRVRWPATGRELVFESVARNTTLVAIEPEP